MSATRILWGQIACVLTIVLITTWTATQWTAWRLGYQPQLGHPWFELAPGVPIYLPPAFFWWWYAYDAYTPGVFVEGACVAASGGILYAAPHPPEADIKILAKGEPPARGVNSARHPCCDRHFRIDFRP